MKKGIVHLVGAGPGNEGLITVRGLSLLRSADAVVYDRLANPALLRHVRSDALRVDAGRWTRKDPRRQPRIHSELARLARRGLQVVRLKGGDPLIFGRGAEEAEYLRKRKIPYEIVPAPTAACASAYAGIPLTHRDWASKVTILTGRQVDSKGPVDVSNVPRDGTLVVYMGVSALQSLSRRLVDAGWKPSTPAATIEWASRGRQRTITAPLSRIAVQARRAKIRTPAMTIFGRVVKLRSRLAWFEKMPLFGRTVVVTRPEDQRLSSWIVEQGGDVILAPSIRIEPIAKPKGLREAIRELHKTEVLMFSSRTAVRLFMGALFERGYDVRTLWTLDVCAIGPGTAASLADFGIRADLVAPQHTTRALTRAVAHYARRGCPILYPCAEQRNRDVARTLRDLGGPVREIVMYRIRPVAPRGVGDIPEDAIVTLTSALTAKTFVRAAGKRRFRYVCIGPVTARAVRALGRRVAGMAKKHDMNGLMEAVRKVARKR